MNLELMAMRWLRWEKRCPIVIRERSPREVWCGRPDVLGVTNARFMIEIEIKRTVSDFRADRQKSSRHSRCHFLEKLPRQIYYLVPEQILGRVETLLSDWAGLMTDSHAGLRVVRESPRNPEAKKLTVKECCCLVRLVNNHAISELEQRVASLGKFRDGHRAFPDPLYEI